MEIIHAILILISQFYSIGLMWYVYVYIIIVLLIGVRSSKVYYLIILYIPKNNVFSNTDPSSSIRNVHVFSNSWPHKV